MFPLRICGKVYQRQTGEGVHESCGIETVDSAAGKEGGNIQGASGAVPSSPWGMLAKVVVHFALQAGYDRLSVGGPLFQHRLEVDTYLPAEALFVGFAREG